MRIVSVLLLVAALAVHANTSTADETTEARENFKMCEADNPQKCSDQLYLPCGADPGAAALISCQKKGWKFFTVAKIKADPGGLCGATVFNVRCQ